MIPAATLARILGVRPRDVAESVETYVATTVCQCLCELRKLGRVACAGPDRQRRYWRVGEGTDVGLLG